jgi:hypothetical protein
MFGPSFFLGELGRFVRDHCPSPEEHLPMVQIRLADGQTLDPCHIVGVSAHWVVLAVRDAAGRQEDMAIELVPFEMVRVCAFAPGMLQAAPWDSCSIMHRPSSGRRHCWRRHFVESRARLTSIGDTNAFQRVTRRNNCALSATMIVLADMSTAPAAGDKTNPQCDNTPAARGMAMTLYPAAHHRFCTIFR